MAGSGRALLMSGVGTICPTVPEPVGWQLTAGAPARPYQRERETLLVLSAVMFPFVSLGLVWFWFGKSLRESSDACDISKVKLLSQYVPTREVCGGCFGGKVS